MSILLVANTVKMPRDAGGYDRSSCQLEALTNADNLYAAFKKSCSGKMWKPSVQRYANEWLLNLADLQRHLQNNDFELHPTKRSVMRERGKPRLIDSEHIEDRIVQHVSCDDIILPAIAPKIIRDNTASLKGRGIDDCRRRLVTHLSKHYREYGNEGYILIMDYSRYYDNIRHDVVQEQMQEWTQVPAIHSLVDQVLDRSMPDVSYLSEEERGALWDGTYNSLEHEAVPDELKTGQYRLPKSLAAGSQLAQTVGISYPYRIDNYVKIVKGCKYYARYMDDSYVIHPDKEFLKNLRNDIIEYCKTNYGITISPNKTKICPLKSSFRFLQIKYQLTDSGKIVRRINPKKLAERKRVMRRTAPHMDSIAFVDWSKSWYRSYKRYMSGEQKRTYKHLVFELLEVTHGYNHTDRRTYHHRFTS